MSAFVPFRAAAGNGKESPDSDISRHKRRRPGKQRPFFLASPASSAHAAASPKKPSRMGPGCDGADVKGTAEFPCCISDKQTQRRHMRLHPRAHGPFSPPGDRRKANQIPAGLASKLHLFLVDEPCESGEPDPESGGPSMAASGRRIEITI